MEDYLETIYKIIQEKQSVKAIEISRILGVSRSSVSGALQTLAEKKLVNYGRYDAISLTTEGEKAAKNVMLKHTVLYRFFTEILGVEAAQAQESACAVEHVISEDILRRLMCFIEFNSANANNSHWSNQPDYLARFKKFCNENLINIKNCIR